MSIIALGALMLIVVLLAGILRGIRHVEVLLSEILNRLLKG